MIVLCSDSVGISTWGFTGLKTFNNYTIIMTNNSDRKKNIMSVVVLFPLLIFELIVQPAALVNFMLFLNIFKILKISF